MLKLLFFLPLLLISPLLKSQSADSLHSEKQPTNTGNVQERMDKYGILLEFKERYNKKKSVHAKVLMINNSTITREKKWFSINTFGKLAIFGPGLEVGYHYDNGGKFLINFSLIKSLQLEDDEWLRLTEFKTDASCFFIVKDKIKKKTFRITSQDANIHLDTAVVLVLKTDVITKRRLGFNAGIAYNSLKNSLVENTVFKANSIIFNAGLVRNIYFDARIILGNNLRRVCVRRAEQTQYINLLYATPLNSPSNLPSYLFSQTAAKWGVIVGFKNKRYKSFYDLNSKPQKRFIIYGLEGGFTPGPLTQTLLYNMSIFSMRVGFGF